MWRGMWTSGRRAGAGDDPERQRCVAADAARKRSARRYTNHGLEPPSSLLRRETEEYNRRQARLSSGAGSSSGTGSSSAAGSSHTPFRAVKMEPVELPPLRAVKREPEEEPERRGGGVVGPEDFLPLAQAEAMEAAILARSAREEEEAAQRHRRDAELDQVLLEQGLAKARDEENLAGWRHEAKAQDNIYIDLGSVDDD